MLTLKMHRKHVPSLKPGLWACRASLKSHPWILNADNLPFSDEKLMAWLASDEIYYLEVYE